MNSNSILASTANMDQLQQPQARYPQPPKLTRPSSVLLEPSKASQMQQQQQHLSHQQDKSGNRPRSQSHTLSPSYLPPLSNTTSSSSGTSHESASENPIRFQAWGQPAHKSKLSKQYMPSEEDSDDETDVKRRSKFMSGAALELNSTSADGLRAFSQLSISESTQESGMPSFTDSADSRSLKSTKKMSLGKRISKFFGGGNKSTEPVSSSSSSSTKSPASSIHGSDLMTPARNSTTLLAPIDELDAPPSRAAHAVYIHQRSQSTPDQIGTVGVSGSNQAMLTGQNAKVEDQRLLKARDSGFEEADGKGHRRYSSSIAVPRGPTSRSSSPKPQSHSLASSASSNRSSIHRSEAMYIDQSAQQVRRSTYGNGNVQLSTSSPQLRLPTDKELPQHYNHHHSLIGAELAPTSTSSQSSMPRRCSTPVSVPETLISKVDREKASICFQTPNAKKDTFTKDANLDPVLSNLVQQHRRDIIASQRLSGTNLPQQSQQQQQHSALPHQGGSPRMRASSHIEDQIMLAREPHARWDSSGSLHFHVSSGMNSPQQSWGHPSSPVHYAAAEAQMKRLSTASQQQQHHPYYSAGQRMNFSGSQGSLSQHTSSQSQGPHSPLAGPQRTSPKRASLVGHFPISTDFTQMPHVSPLPSPNLGAFPTSSPAMPSPTKSIMPEISLKQQKQQLDQLQQIRIQQQQLMLQQQQQLQHQLQQTRAATATATAMKAQSGIGLGLAGVGSSVLQVQIPTVQVPKAMTSMPSPLVLTPTYLQAPHLVQMPKQQTIPMYAYTATTASAAGYR
ncbi:hypothetical protein BGZ65_003046 [Modicella reniformis]|uniref:Uncharacterized protein n=1 Tax=Modicella reniformis TaxID=1440133 RepID=A0A9P6IKU4_9FUNG|nr:hypothetical protein BGZ65_003046 [Modicella reniformis]